MQKLLQNKLFNLLPFVALIVGLVLSVVAYFVASYAQIHKESFTPIDTFLPLIVLFGGLLTSVLLCVLVWALVHARTMAVKMAESAIVGLKDVEERYRILVSNLQIGVLIQSPTSEITLSNQRAFELLGLSQDQLIGKTSLDEDWKVIHEDGTPFPGSTHPVPQAIASSQPVHDVVMGVYHPITKGTVWLLVNADPELNDDGSIREVICTFTDITERKKMEEKLQIEHEALIQSSKMAELGNMLGVIIHQWKQPLNVLAIDVQSVQLAYEDDELDAQKMNEFVACAMETIDFMGKTADDFRNFYKPSKEKKLFSIMEQVRSVTKLLEKQLKLNSISLSVEGDASVCIMGFTSELKQVVLNIINNAKDALIDREVNSAKLVVRLSVEGEKAVLTICDNAGGIPSELLPDKLFEAFTSTKGQNGTGIGLSLSRTIIEENMQGRLSASNTIDGACFVVELPIAASL
jgi:PAS domain S-box-containing protein